MGPFRPAIATFLFLLLPVLALGTAAPARADDEPQTAPAGPPDLELGVIVGDRVNVRVGPRMDNHPVRQLEEGDVVLIVERVPGWIGVRVPAGFPVSVASRYVVPVGPDTVRVDATNLNFRQYPPAEGKAPPGLFRDHAPTGGILTVIEEEGDWVWVVAPEEVRAYVDERFVKSIGPASEHADLLDKARTVRQEEATQLSNARRAAAEQLSGLRLRAVLSEIQQSLYVARKDAGYDKAPIVALANRLDGAIDQERSAPTRVLMLARALREDLEREIVLRVARYDAEVAQAQGLPPRTVPPLEPQAESFAAEGEIRYEPTPGWKQEGIYLLWIGDRPVFALRLTTGGPLPLPDFAAHVERGPRRVVGSKPGERLFGLPVIDVTSISQP